jgi:hypothetical protein
MSTTTSEFAAGSSVIVDTSAPACRSADRQTLELWIADAGTRDFLDGTHEPRTSFGLAEVIEHLYCSPKFGDRIGNTFAGNIEGQTVDGLEHRRKAALRISVGSRRYAAAGERPHEIRMQLVATMVSRLCGFSVICTILASTRILSQVTSENSFDTSTAISSYITMP